MTRQDDQGEGERHLRLAVRLRRIEHGEGLCESSLTVHCPLAAEAETLEHCARCPRFQALGVEEGRAVLECRVPQAVAPPLPSGVSLVDALRSVHVGQLASPNVTCFDPGLPIVEAAKLLGSTPQPALVVDDHGVLLGTVTLEDCDGQDELEDAMRPVTATIAQTATLFETVALMARLPNDRLPIVAASGEVVGIITALDVVRWLAREGKLPEA